jgi:hypothetical protein
LDAKVVLISDDLIQLLVGVVLFGEDIIMQNVVTVIPKRPYCLEEFQDKETGPSLAVVPGLKRLEVCVLARGPLGYMEAFKKPIPA